MKQRVVITGCGVASPLGNNLADFCRHLHAGRFGIRPISRYDTTPYTTKVAAELDPIPQPTHLPTQRKLNNAISTVCLCCAEQAIDTAQLDLSTYNREQVGVILGSGFLNLYDLEASYETMFTVSPLKVSPLTVPVNMGSSPANRVGMAYGLQGIIKSVTTACSSGLTALLDSVRLIQHGEQQVMLTGGADLVTCESLMVAWERLRVPSKVTDPTLACRPFDRARSGIVMGDGAAFFVLESLAHAQQRQAPILAEVRAISQTADSVDLVKPDAAGEVRCLQTVLAKAALSPTDIGLIHAHGTSTTLNDAVEYEALSTVFGAHLADIPLCAIKAMLGHTMGASGSLALAAALGTFQDGYIYPIPNLTQLDEGMRLRVSQTGQLDPTIDHILINTFAFGGINNCLIVSKI